MYIYGSQNRLNVFCMLVYTYIVCDFVLLLYKDNIIMCCVIIFMHVLLTHMLCDVWLFQICVFV